MTRQDYLWCGAALLAIAIAYAVGSFLGLVPRPETLLVLVLGPGIVAALLSVLAPSGRVAGLATLFLVCVLFLEGPLAKSLFGEFPGVGGWVATIGLFGGPLVALYAALRLKPPRAAVGVQTVGAFARALTFYAGAVVLISTVLLMLALLTVPRTG